MVSMVFCFRESRLASLHKGDTSVHKHVEIRAGKSATKGVAMDDGDSKTWPDLKGTKQKELALAQI